MITEQLNVQYEQVLMWYSNSFVAMRVALNPDFNFKKKY